MKKGTQIAYVPLHANGDIKHKDVIFGFVTSQRDEGHFCRYWLPGKLGQLRTVANSEFTPNYCLVKYVSVSQSVVDKALEMISQAQKGMQGMR